MMETSGQWAAEGGGAQDVYTGQRLLFKDAQATGDKVLGAIKVRTVIGRYLLVSLLATAVTAMLWLFFYRWSDIRITPWALYLLWVFFASIKTTTWASHWHLVVDDAAEAADQSFAAIGRAALQRELPVEITPRRVYRPGRPRRNYLLVRDEPISAYVSVSAYGTGLYLGWSMWRRESLLSMLWLYLRLLPFLKIHLRQYLAADDTRALREALHNVVREGVEAAVLRNGPALEEVFSPDLLAERPERRLFGMPTRESLMPRPVSPSIPAVQQAPPPPIHYEPAPAAPAPPAPSMSAEHRSGDPNVNQES